MKAHGDGPLRDRIERALDHSLGGKRGATPRRATSPAIQARDIARAEVLAKLEQADAAREQAAAIRELAHQVALMERRRRAHE